MKAKITEQPGLSDRVITISHFKRYIEWFALDGQRDMSSLEFFRALAILFNAFCIFCNLMSGDAGYEQMLDDVHCMLSGSRIIPISEFRRFMESLECDLDKASDEENV